MKKQTFKTFKVNDIDRELQWFKKSLTDSGLAERTVDSYYYCIRNFLNRYQGYVSVNIVMQYKARLIEELAPKTVNVRINALNRYLFEKDINYRLKNVRIQDKQYVEDVISMSDYKYLKEQLKKDEDYTNYFLIWALGCTGARVSEIVQMKIEHVYDGQFEIYGKGLKSRVIFITSQFQKECIEWIESQNRTSGFLFLDNKGNPITKTKVETATKNLGKKYGINPEVMHPHSFRHLFAKSFNKKNPNLVLLKDIMGHTNIATTAIYCKPTLTELVTMYNEVVDW